LPVPTILLIALVVVVVMLLAATLKIIRQQQVAIVERLGKFRKVLDPGPHLVVPFLDQIRYALDMREEVVPFPPQGVITEDNLIVSIDSVIYFQIVDPVRAAYEASLTEQTEGDGKVHLGTVFSRDHFYFTPEGQNEALAGYGVLGVEMEAAALYGVAAEYGKQALAVLTVSDHLLDHSGDMSAAERETRFADSLRLAVAAAHS